MGTGNEVVFVVVEVCVCVWGGVFHHRESNG